MYIHIYIYMNSYENEIPMLASRLVSPRSPMSRESCLSRVIIIVNHMFHQFVGKGWKVDSQVLASCDGIQ